jgi:hypothetical protein
VATATALVPRLAGGRSVLVVGGGSGKGPAYARFAAPRKPRGVMAGTASLAYILGVSASPPKFVRPCIPTTAKAIPRGDGCMSRSLTAIAFSRMAGCFAYIPRMVATGPSACRAWPRRWQVFAAGPQ